MNLHLSKKSRLFNLCGFITYVGLAIFVFTWGLQYKLSLYDPPQATSHQIPQAKLLSKNEQTGATQSPLVVQIKPSTRVNFTGPTSSLFLLVFALSVLVEATDQRNRHTTSIWRPRRGLFEIFFVRPPPLLA